MTEKTLGQVIADLESCERLLADTHRARDRVEILLARLIGNRANGNVTGMDDAYRAHLETSFREHTDNIHKTRLLIAHYTLEAYSVGGATAANVQWMEEV
jgi:hypothetical protein